MRQGQHRYAPYAEALGVTGRAVLAQQEIVNREKHRIRQALERWMLDIGGRNARRWAAGEWQRGRKDFSAYPHFL